ncbi:type III-B CRISPR module-associated protein Cmr3 [Halorhodospira halophila]|uniref:CRISPR-associated protein, Cmr3 family n=1 Tax=Halorhodospira halophila (strain DSM 244 / SL1) TaxID=349124 RepID=A1WUQ1_HALHL|nr:type III-B CRISPR module-associated protein Cmr3 [Halorhodospira halophila]ABM61413.1 CRISPR-associated protein, Cmr3 family [Halorhodospira halophila SL1]MBK1728655.1 type III-B CRISPR module-associated protein Cmr3 [Halorhodospira halophila]
MAEYRYIEPQDVLFFRGNRLFGEPGNAGAALMPPWPSVFAGALRSAMLSAAGADPAQLRSGELPAPLDTVLGTPEEPGTFTLTGVTLARRQSSGTAEPLHPLPADLSVERDEATGECAVHRLTPQPLPAGVASSQPLERLPVLRRSDRGKPAAGYWLTHSGWQRYCQGEPPPAEALVHRSAIWSSDPRLGIALKPEQRTAAESQLYTTEGIRLCEGYGFLAAIAGSDPTSLPKQATLRLGGDGRGAFMSAVAAPVETSPEPAAIEAEGRLRIVLTTPGIFPGGWQLPGLDANGLWHYPGGRARLVAAAVPRGQVISGWDLAHHRPKPAQRAAPAGTVYWLEALEGGLKPLRKLAESGLWGMTPENEDPARRAEGFNRFAIANA